MYYYLYKTTNIVNGKFYIGVHTTTNLSDGYLGSGLNLQRAVKKYGKESFKKDILEYFNNEQDMFLAEASIVTEDFLKQPNVYNIQIGGNGGFTKEMSVKGANATVRYRVGIHAQTHAEYSAAGKKGSASGILNKRGIHDPKNKDLIRESSLRGSKNAQKVNIGTVFMFHAVVGLKKCKRDLMPEYIDQGWIYLSPKSLSWKIIKSQIE